MTIDYTYLCKKIGDMSGVPIRLYQNDQLIYFYSLFELIKDPLCLYKQQIKQVLSEVGYFITPEFDYYGVLNGHGLTLVIGPTRLTNRTTQEYKRLAFMLEIPPEDIAPFVQALSAINHIPLESILQILCAMNYILNGTKLELTDIDVTDTIQNDITRQSQINITSEMTRNDEVSFQDMLKTYYVEQTLTDIVRRGDTATLDKWLQTPPAIHPGTLSSNLLRQYKNNIIISVSLYTRAAIRGGMDLTDAMRLSDSYIQKIEHLQSLEQISNIAFHIIKEFTARVATARFNNHQSELVKQVNSYVRRHISEKIKTEDLAKNLYLSRSHLSAKFKKESGVNLNEYIALLKISEAKHLLAHTDKNLLLISSYLGYSSQSYFCNTFKKYTGKTPKEYRDSL